MATTVYIWKNTKKYTTGHSALSVLSEEIGIEEYLSFWPEDRAGKEDFLRKWRGTNTAIEKGLLAMRGEENFFKMTHKSAFTIPDDDNYIKRKTELITITLFGLNEHEMMNFIRRIKHDMKRYNMMRYNCSTIVAEALRVGSKIKPKISPIKFSECLEPSIGGALPPYMAKPLLFTLGHSRMWTPNAVALYARQLEHLFVSGQK